MVNLQSFCNRCLILIDFIIETNTIQNILIRFVLVLEKVNKKKRTNSKKKINQRNEMMLHSNYYYYFYTVYTICKIKSNLMNALS